MRAPGRGPRSLEEEVSELHPGLAELRGGRPLGELHEVGVREEPAEPGEVDAGVAKRLQDLDQLGAREVERGTAGERSQVVAHRFGQAGHVEEPLAALGEPLRLEGRKPPLEALQGRDGRGPPPSRREPAHLSRQEEEERGGERDGEPEIERPERPHEERGGRRDVPQVERPGRRGGVDDPDPRDARTRDGELRLPAGLLDVEEEVGDVDLAEGEER